MNLPFTFTRPFCLSVSFRRFIVALLSNVSCVEARGTPMPKKQTNHAAIHLSEQSKHVRSRGEAKTAQETMKLPPPPAAIDFR